MRALWLGVSLALVTALAGACGDDQAQDTTAPSGGGGGGGKSGGTAGGSTSTAGKSAGGSGNGGVSGSVALAGSGGADGAGASGGDANAGASGSGDTNAGGSDGAAGAGMGGAANAGAAGAAGTSAGGDGAAGSPGDCDIASPDKVIFVSSALYTGNLGGLTGADLKCQTLADAANLCGTFKAWLSDGTGNAADCLTHATGNYILPDSQVVASAWDGLISGTLQHAINQTESKGVAPVGTVKCGPGSQPTPVWTGATNSGIAVPNGSCSNWGSTSTSPGAAFGNATATNFAWSGTCQIVTLCPNTAALYCVQQ